MNYWWLLGNDAGAKVEVTGSNNSHISVCFCRLLLSNDAKNSSLVFAIEVFLVANLYI